MECNGLHLILASERVQGFTHLSPENVVMIASSLDIWLRSGWWKPCCLAVSMRGRKPGRAAVESRVGGQGVCFHGDRVVCVSISMALMSLALRCYSLSLSLFRQDRDIEPEDFQKYTENVQTSLQDCPVERPPAALLSKHSKNSKQGHIRKVKK